MINTLQLAARKNLIQMSLQSDACANETPKFRNSVNLKLGPARSIVCF
jgi:hypothetical protein